MATSTVENYLKAIFGLSAARGPGRRAALGDVAVRLGVTPGTVTSMMKHLAESGLVDYEPRGGVKLTAAGHKLAVHVLRRHRLIELFLVEVLGLDWSQVHDEAEELEHAISDRVLERIDAMLGHPTADPHGDPIPDASGRMPQRRVAPLSECAPGAAVIARVTDHSRAFLGYMEQQGLGPNVQIHIVARDTVADTVTITRPDGEQVQLGSSAADKLLVTPSAAARQPTGRAGRRRPA